MPGHHLEHGAGQLQFVRPLALVDLGNHQRRAIGPTRRDASRPIVGLRVDTVAGRAATTAQIGVLAVVQAAIRSDVLGAELFTERLRQHQRVALNARR